MNSINITDLQDIIFDSIIKSIGVDIRFSNRVNNAKLKEQVEARGIYCKIMREYGFTYEQIGSSIKKSHATMLNNKTTIEDSLEVDKSLQLKYYRILSDVNSKAPLVYLAKLERLNQIEAKINQTKDMLNYLCDEVLKIKKEK